MKKLHCERKNIMFARVSHRALGRIFVVAVVFIALTVVGKVALDSGKTRFTGLQDIVPGLPRVSRLRGLALGTGNECPKTDHPTYFVFIKVHKAGSTTIYNMLARYALAHDLNVALPELDLEVSCRHTFGPIKEEHVIPLAPGQHYHMLFSHMTYNRSVIENFMPRDTFYFAIMRDPFRRVLSGLYYYQKLRAPAENDTENEAIKALLGNMARRAKWAGDCRLHNSILCDTGLPLPLQDDDAAVREHLKKLDLELDLMLVTEHFMESLVLLKRRACLQLKDIIHHKFNSRGRKPKTHKILEEDLAEFRAWQKGDYMAYEYFYRKFWDEVRKEGADFYQEVLYFKGVNDRVANYCSNSKEKELDTVVVAKSLWNEEFSFNSRDCEILRTGEVTVHRLLVYRAWARRKKGGYRETRETIPQWTPTC